MSRNPNPKPREIQDARPALAGITLCHWCGTTFVSALRPFPVPYVCVDCLLEHGPPASEPWHGTMIGYKGRECRCAACRMANAENQRVYRSNRST